MELKRAGMEKAAELWEMLEHLPVAPVDVYKTASAMKCSEFASRIRAHKAASEIIELLEKFLGDTLALVGGTEAGNAVEGARVLAAIDGAMPLTDEVFNDPIAYAQRQHVYDGLLLLAGSRLGKEAETAACIDGLQDSVTNLVIMTYYGGGYDPDKPEAVN